MKTLLAAVAALLFLLPAAHAQEAEREGTVVDGTTDKPLAGVTVTVGDRPCSPTRRESSRWRAAASR